VVIDAGPKNTTNEDALPSEGRSLLTKPLTEPTLLEMSGYRVYQELGHRTIVACLRVVANSSCLAQEEYYDAQARGPNRKLRQKGAT
jgi:hypothetical protein